MSAAQASARFMALAALALVTLLGGSILLLVPWNADPGWWDASRHAMDGAFYLDMIRSGGFLDPLGYAQDYYARYPAIAPAVYPPLFGVAEAALFAVFGVDAFVARVAVVLFLLAGAWGLLRFTEPAWGWPAGLCAAGLYLTLPLVLHWGREVMLEPAATALVIWSVVWAQRFLASHRTPALAWSVGFAVLAPYAKQNAVLVFPVLVAGLLLAGQQARLLERRAILAGLGAALCGAPLAYVTLRYGGVNLGQAFSQREEALPLLTHLSFHLLWLPRSVGWPVLGLSALGLARALGARATGSAIERISWALLLAWAVVGYAFLLPLLKEVRHGFPWIPVFAVLGGIGLARVLSPFRDARAIVAGASAACVGLFASGASEQKLWCEGFEGPATHLAEHWDGAAVLTSLEHDGSFVFRMRSVGDERFRVYRSAKIFESTMLHKRWGVDAKIASSVELYAALERYGIRYVVLEDEIPSETPVERLLREAVQSDRFAREAEFPVVCPSFRENGLQAHLRQVGVFRYLGEIRETAERPPIFLPVVKMELPARPQ